MRLRRFAVFAVLLPLLAACATRPAQPVSAPAPQGVWGFENSDIAPDPAFRFGRLDNLACKRSMRTKGARLELVEARISRIG